MGVLLVAGTRSFSWLALVILQPSVDRLPTAAEGSSGVDKLPKPVGVPVGVTLLENAENPAFIIKPVATEIPNTANSAITVIGTIDLAGLVVIIVV